MTDYHLHLSHWMWHHWGRVEGPPVESCHGTARWEGIRHVCAEGHQLPRLIDWSVEEIWTEQRANRYRAMNFEGAGPNQFETRKRLIEVAILRFTRQAPSQPWEGVVVPGMPGDRLILGGRLHGPDNINPDYRPDDECPPWGSILAEIPVVEPGTMVRVPKIGKSRPYRLQVVSCEPPSRETGAIPVVGKVLPATGTTMRTRPKFRGVVLVPGQFEVVGDGAAP